MRITIILVWLFISNVSVLSAQKTRAEADSISYQLYKDSAWGKLANYGRAACHNEFDFYGLNIRTGIAFFYLGQWRNAELYFRRSLSNYPDDILAKEYLYWVCRYTGKRIEAAAIYHDMPEDVQARLEDLGKPLVASLLLESGIRTTSTPDSAMNFKFAGLGIHHQFSSALDLYHAYSYLEQDFYWGGFKQHQYYFAPRLHLKNGWAVQAGINGIIYKSDFDYLGGEESYNDTVTVDFSTSTRAAIYQSDYDYIYTGNYALEALFSHFALSKTIGRTHFAMQFAYYAEKSELTYVETIDSVSIIDYYLDSKLDSTSTISGADYLNSVTKSSYNQYQLGASASYSLPLNNGRYAILGAELHLVFAENLNWHLVPFFQLQLSNSFHLSGNYMRKGNYPFSVFNGTLVLNNYDRLLHRLTLTGKYKINKQLDLYATFQWESVQDDFLLDHYTTKGIFTGARWSF